MLSGNLINMVKTIRRVGETVDYVFPGNVQHESLHKELLQMSIIKNACKSMSKEGQFRNIIIILPDEIGKLYMDDQHNFVFRTYYLEEKNFIEKDIIAPVKYERDDQNEIMKLCMDLKAQLAVRELSLADIEKKFILDKFNGKQVNAREWLDQFEKECNRYEVCEEARKIQSLKFFLEDGAKEWYSSNLRKLSINKWEEWSRSFLLVYADKSWSNIRFAYNFKFLKGSLIDYALKKERLLLEIESSMSNTSRINLIVIGLPVYIQDKLDKEEIINTDVLMNKIRMYDSGYIKQKRDDMIKYNNNNGNNIIFNGKVNAEKKYSTMPRMVIEKKPCVMCEALNKPDRYHPLHLCRNKQQYTEMKKVNLLEVNHTEMEESVNTELDNQKN